MLQRILLSLLLILLSPLALQAAPGGASPLAIKASELKQIGKIREQVEKDSTLSEEQKKPILALYDEASDWVNRARTSAEQTKLLIRQRTEAPRTTASIRKALAKGLKEKPLDMARLKKKPLPELVQLVATEKANLDSREARVSELEQKLASDSQRPDAARKRLAEAKQELEALQKKLESQPKEADPLQRERHWRDKAHALALQNEIRMLEQELLTLPAQRALDEAMYEEAKARSKLAEARVEKLEELLNERRRKEVEKLSRAEEAAQQAVAGKSPLLEQVAAENTALSDQLAAALQELEEASSRDNKLKERAKWIQEMYQTTREKVKVAGMSGALGLVLLEQRNQLPDLRRLKRDMADIHKRITDTTLRQIRHREALRDLSDGRNVVIEWPEGMSEKERKRLEPQLRKLLERKRELLKKLVNLDNEQLKALAELEVAMQELVNSVQEFDAYLAEHLLWVRNTRTIHLSDLARLPEELHTLFDPRPWMEV